MFFLFVVPVLICYNLSVWYLILRDTFEMLSNAYPYFTVGCSEQQFVSEFKYLVHIITNDLSDDADDQKHACNANNLA